MAGHPKKAEYDRRGAVEAAELDMLRVPEQPDVEGAGEVLESLGAEWVSAPLRYQQKMLRKVLEAMHVDVLGRKLVCVKPFPPFLPLFKMDGMEEREDGCFYYEEDEEAQSEG